MSDKLENIRNEFKSLKAVDIVESETKDNSVFFMATIGDVNLYVENYMDEPDNDDVVATAWMNKECFFAYGGSFDTVFFELKQRLNP